MSRYVILLVILAGCSGPIQRTDSPEITAALACEGAVAVLQARKPFQPAPQPPSAKCENCNGTGKLGDTRVMYDCPVCKGTGRTPEPATP